MGKRWLILVALILIIELILIVRGVVYRQNFQQDFDLVSSSRFDGSAVLDIRLEQAFFPTSFEVMETWGVLAVSTGRVYTQVLKDSTTDEEIGIATILEVVTRDRDDPDNIKRLPLIVQLAPAGNLERNLLPWVLESAIRLRSLPVEVSANVLSREQISEIFPRGTTWNFVPLVDLNREELNQVVEYVAYAERYYGGKTYPKIDKLFKSSPDNHALLGEASIPVLLLAIPGYLAE